MDLLVGASALGLCLREDECDFDAFASAGLQAKVWANSTTHVGARVTVDTDVARVSGFHLVSGGGTLALGSTRHRFVAELLVLHYHDDEFPENDGAYGGAAVGYSLLGERFGLLLLAGLAAPFEGQPDPLPIASFAVLWR
jgi:hypothetical protein